MFNKPNSVSWEILGQAKQCLSDWPPTAEMPWQGHAFVGAHTYGLFLAANRWHAPRRFFISSLIKLG